MARDIFEGQVIGLIALLKQGQPAGTKVVFVVNQDDAELTRVDGEIVTDANARTGKAATTTYTAADVPPDKPSYLLTYKAIADNQDYKSDDEIRVWPKKAKVTALKNADSSVFKGFRFKVMQNAEQVGPIQKAIADTAVVEFDLKKGFGFAVASAEPYEIKSTELNGTALRDLKVKGVLNFEAEFVSPKRPVSGEIKQWVNFDLDPVAKGTDGNGTSVEISVGVKGDRDEATGVTKAEIIGAAGIFVYVKVKFRGPGGKKSLRDTPKTDLVAGLDLSDRVEVKVAATDPEWELTGKVELKSAGGVGKFKVELGKAGGDVCEIELGSTDALGGPKLTFTNWRKLWYEIMAPDFMDLTARVVPSVGSLRDFAATGLANLKASGDATFIEYEIFKSHSFTEAECPAGTVLDRGFFQRTAGNQKVYLLTDHTFKLYPKPFDKSKGLRSTCLKACDVNYYSDGPTVDADVDRIFDATVAACAYDFQLADGSTYWIPNSGYNGTTTIRKIDWVAKIPTPNTYQSRPTVSWDPNDGTRAEPSDAECRITISETLQNPAPVDVKFVKTTGNVATDLDATAKGAIDTWLNGLYTVATLRAQGNKLKFKLQGLLGNARRDLRFQNIKSYIATKVAASAPLVYTHPGLDDTGTPLSGSLNPTVDVDMTRSHRRKIAINLPAVAATDPGKFVGTASATKCPITLTVRFEPQHEANGVAGQGAQKGEILVTWGIDCPLSITDTFLHELGHQYNMAVVARGASSGLDDHKWRTADATHASGMPLPKTIAEDETNVDYQNTGAKGHYYTRRAHSGAHCAWGLTDAEKLNPGTGRGVCTMFGAGVRDDNARTRLTFCAQCRDYIRARDLSALK